uniref:Uncharacterized protein n=1 Tax=Clytia hemisphaerica TaxID=252671 RepID=A0A7M5XBL4_9CNID
KYFASINDFITFFAFRMSHYSSVKLTENRVKKLLTVPSKWVMGKNLYYPKDKFSELKLSRQLADPQADWKEIPIEQELIRFRTMEECHAVKSGTEYDDTDQEIGNSLSHQKVTVKRKSCQEENKTQTSLPGGMTPDSNRREIVSSSSEKKQRLTSKRLADITSPVLNGACSASAYKNMKSRISRGWEGLTTLTWSTSHLTEL